MSGQRESNISNVGNSDKSRETRLSPGLSPTAPCSALDVLFLLVDRTYFLRMLINSFSLDESSGPLTSVVVAAEGSGVERLGVDGRDDGLEACGVVVDEVDEGPPDDAAAEAMLTVSEAGGHAAVVFLERVTAGI